MLWSRIEAVSPRIESATKRLSKIRNLRIEINLTSKKISVPTDWKVCEFINRKQLILYVNYSSLFWHSYKTQKLAVVTAVAPYLITFQYSDKFKEAYFLYLNQNNFSNCWRILLGDRDINVGVCCGKFSAFSFKSWKKKTSVKNLTRRPPRGNLA